MSYFLHIYYCHIGRQTKYFSLCILYLSKRIFPGEFILLLPTMPPSISCLCWLECEVCICHFTIFTISIFFSTLLPLRHSNFITIHLFNGGCIFSLFFLTLYLLLCYFYPSPLFFVYSFYIFYVLILKADFSYPCSLFFFSFYPLVEFCEIF